jgi:protein-tyrosine kinase
MNQHTSLGARGTLIERAAERYALGGMQPADVAAAVKPVAEKLSSTVASSPPSARGAKAVIDRVGLAEDGFVVPGASVSGIAEEFRIVKRQLLLAMRSREILEEKRQSILVCSASPDEGKTFCTINLALSLAEERDSEVLLVDGDFAKPEILRRFGVEARAGLIDAISDPHADPNDLVIGTDVPGLSLLAAGRAANNVTELLASSRTAEVIRQLTEQHPRRILLFDSPPALMASPASVLAGHVGQLLMVVRADRTVEADLKEAVTLLSGCAHIRLLLNGAALSTTSRRFGSYYGYPQ